MGEGGKEVLSDSEIGLRSADSSPLPPVTCIFCTSSGYIALALFGVVVFRQSNRATYCWVERLRERKRPVGAILAVSDNAHKIAPRALNKPANVINP